MSQVQEIKEKLDIVEIIGDKVSLSRSGKNFRGLCPFHSEKTPSFFVSPQMQSFICFGCAKKGDVFTFVQEYDRLTFPEALELLADKAGVELDKTGWSDPQENQRRALLEILDLSAQYFAYLLEKHPSADSARAYLKQRDLSAAIRRNYNLGFAPPGWDNLFTYLTKKKKFAPADVEAAGLAIRGQGGKYYDRFRNRIMFPLHDHRGRVVGFSGRLLDSNAKEAKYVNTSETPVFHKRYLLYGYHQNLEAIREKEAVIVVEGEFDMLSSVQAHIKHVVAIKGSALTVEQIRLLSRTAKTIYLALDADDAGVTATARAIELVQPFPVALRIIPLTGGKDPDDLARQDPRAWRETVSQHVSAFEYVLEATSIRVDLQTAQGQKTVATTMLKLLLTIENAVERSFYLKQLAQKLGVSESVLEEDWQRLRRRASVAGNIAPRSESTQSSSPEASDRLGSYLWQLLLRLEKVPSNISIDPTWFKDTIHQRLAQLYKTNSTSNEFSLADFSRKLPAELQSAATELALLDLPLEETEWEREVLLVVSQLKQRQLKQKRQTIADDLAVLEKKESLTPEEEAQFTQLQQEFLRLNQS